MAQQERPEDYNAFGYDPRGRVANMAGLMFGEDWRPDQQNIPRHHGPNVAPPRFGPPADYQRPHLPNNFVPHLPHDGYLGALQYQRREGPWAHYPPPPPHYAVPPMQYNLPPPPGLHAQYHHPQLYQQPPVPKAASPVSMKSADAFGCPLTNT
ncbi:hypothetical protein L208DRAFT_1374474 [Tricholoma matsutake]|nr:hypothetical protein L208DRAFT_1374474 [Tricholoma matsutake 945]